MFVLIFTYALHAYEGNRQYDQTKRKFSYRFCLSAWYIQAYQWAQQQVSCELFFIIDYIKSLVVRYQAKSREWSSEKPRIRITCVKIMQAIGMHASHERFSRFSRRTRTTSTKFFFLKQALTKWTSLSNPRSPMQQSKRNRNASQTNETKERSTPRHTKRIIKRGCSEGEQRSSNTPHDNRSCECASRVDFVRVCHICEKRSKDDLVSESKDETWDYRRRPVEACSCAPGKPKQAHC